MRRSTAEALPRTPTPSTSSPTYNDSGPVRDTYCVKGNETEVVEIDHPDEGEGNMLRGTAGSKAGFRIGLMLLTYAFLWSLTPTRFWR